jgi:hypothetical protein
MSCLAYGWSIDVCYVLMAAMAVVHVGPQVLLPMLAIVSMIKCGASNGSKWLLSSIVINLACGTCCNNAL